jgi:hypothetical protein
VAERGREHATGTWRVEGLHDLAALQVYLRCRVVGDQPGLVTLDRNAAVQRRERECPLMFLERNLRQCLA